MSENPFEIPHSVRDMAEQNMKQAHDAYEQLTDFVTKTMSSWMGAMPSNPMTIGFKDVQDRAMDFAKDNAEFGFLLRWKDLQRTGLARNSDDSNAIRSRSDAGLHLAHAGALRLDRGSFPEAPTPLIYPSELEGVAGKTIFFLLGCSIPSIFIRRVNSPEHQKSRAQEEARLESVVLFPPKEHQDNKREPDLFHF